MSSVIGALRVNLGLDSAQFESGAKKAGKTTSDLKANIVGMAKSLAAPIAAMASFAGAMALAGRGAADIDKVAKSARRIGASVTGYRAMELAAGEAGVAVSTLADAVQTMDREIAKGGKGATDALKKLGLSARDLAGLDADEKLALISDQIKKMGLDTGQTSAVLQELGIRNKEMLLAVQSGGDIFRNARKDIESYGLGLSSVQTDEIEAANDAIGRLSLVGQYLAQQLSLAVTPALGQLSKVMTDSLRQGGLLRGVLDLIVYSVKIVVGAVRLLIDGFLALQTAMDIPARVFNWMFDLGPTALQAQQAVDQLTLAMGQQVTQILALTGEMSNGVIMSKSMATAKLEEARAWLATVDAARQTRIELMQHTSEYRGAELAIMAMEKQLAASKDQLRMMREMDPSGTFTLLEQEVALFSTRIGEARDKQEEMFFAASKITPEYEAAVAEIARLQAAIDQSVDGVVTFNGEIITAEDILKRIAGMNISAGITAAANEAGRLANNLALANLSRENQQAGMTYGKVGARGDPRKFMNGEGKSNQNNTFGGDTYTPKPSRGGSGGGGGKGGGGTDKSTDAVKALREEYDRLKATIGMTAEQQKIYNAVQGLGKEATAAQKAEVAGLIPQIESLKKAMEDIRDSANRGADAIGNLFTSLLDGSKSLKQGIKDLILEIAKMQMMQAVKGLFGAGGALSGVGSFIGKLIGANAAGTSHWQGGLTRVHERGGEIMDLPDGTRIIPHDVSNRMAANNGAGGDKNANITVNVEGARGDQHIIALVRQGISSSLTAYDRNVARPRANMGHG